MKKSDPLFFCFGEKEGKKNTEEASRNRLKSLIGTTIRDRVVLIFSLAKKNHII